jgi:putative tryptophan/tyrosine transport system permease protein
MTLYEFLGTVEISFIFGIVALGAYLSFRVLDFPDLTVEGSFPLGAAVTAVVIVNFGWNPWPATGVGVLAGFLAGLITAFLNVRYNILHILAGILVSIALYSINLRIMGGPNKALLGAPTMFTLLEVHGIPSYIVNPIFLGCVVVLLKLALDFFLATGVGTAIRAAGANPVMAVANGINVGRMKLLGIGLANALTAFAGALFAQLFGAADAYMGIGVVIIGLASVIVGMAIFPARTIMQATTACLAGAMLYRFAVALALNADFLGLQASDLQVVTAVLVALTLISRSRGGIIGRFLARKPAR